MKRSQLHANVAGRELECCKFSGQGLRFGEAPYSVSALFACMRAEELASCNMRLCSPRGFSCAPCQALEVK